MNENEKIAGKAFLEFTKITIEDLGLSAPTPEIIKLLAAECKPKSDPELHVSLFMAGYFLGAGKATKDVKNFTIKSASEHAIQLLKEEN